MMERLQTPAPLAFLLAMDRIAVRAMIRGRVQGVGYRAWAASEARRRGLDGWVRNRADGSVELLAAGPGAAVEALLAACERGPSGARVTSVARYETTEALEAGFRVRPTL
jgi:acylphosphatase